MTVPRGGLRRDTSAFSLTAVFLIAIVIMFAIIAFFSITSLSIFGPPPIEPACELRGVTTPAQVTIAVRIRDGAGGATVAATTTSDETGRYSVVVQCRPGTPYDAKATKAGYFDVILESLPFSTDRATVFVWDVTLTQAP